MKTKNVDGMLVNLQKLVKEHKAEGRGKFPDEVRDGVTALVKSGAKARDISNNLKISYASVLGWVRNSSSPKFNRKAKAMPVAEESEALKSDAAVSVRLVAGRIVVDMPISSFNSVIADALSQLTGK